MSRRRWRRGHCTAQIWPGSLICALPWDRRPCLTSNLLEGGGHVAEGTQRHRLLISWKPCLIEPLVPQPFSSGIIYPGIMNVHSTDYSIGDVQHDGDRELPSHISLWHTSPCPQMIPHYNGEIYSHMITGPTACRSDRRRLIRSPVGIGRLISRINVHKTVLQHKRNKFVIRIAAVTNVSAWMQDAYKINGETTSCGADDELFGSTNNF